MKKLMVMLMGAAAAVCAHTASAEATFQSGSNFSLWTADEFTPPSGETALWTKDAADTSIVSDADGWAQKYDSSTYGLPDQFPTATGAKALKLQTNNKVLERALGAEAKAIGTGLYYDSLVRFTVFDNGDDPTVDNGGKIGVYLQLPSDDDTAVPHLKVVAGEVNSATPAAKVYDCGEITQYVTGWTDGTWVRLTIKALAGIDQSTLPGFVVFVNKNAAVCATAKGDTAFIAGLSAQAAAWNNVNKLFPSIVDNDTLAAVGFNGQGATDLISFTDEAPEFAQDMTFVAADWSALLNKGATVTITVGGETYTPTAAEAAAGKANIVYTGTVPTLKIEWTDGDAICGGEKLFAGNVTITADDIDAAVAKFAGKNYAKLTGENSAVAAANKPTAEGTLKLLAASEQDSIALNNALVTLDLNGQIVGNVGVQNGADVKLANTGDGDAIIKGSVMANKIVTNVKTIKFDYEMNYNDDTGLPYFTADFGDNKWKIAQSDAYYVITDLELWKVTVADPLGTNVKTLTPSPAELYEDAEDKTVTLTATFETGYELDYYTVDGVKIESDNFQLTKSVTVNAVAKSSTIPVTLSVTPATAEITEGDAIPTFTVMNGQTEADEAMYELAWTPETPTTESTAGEYTLTVTPKAPYTGDPASATLTIKAKAAPVIDPTNPEVPVKVTAENEEAAKAAVKISVPDAVKDEVSEEAYQAYFVKTATDNKDGTFNVTAALDDTVIESGETAAELVGKFDEIDEAGVTVKNAKPGLYYSVVEGQALTGRTEGARTLATSEGVTIKATKFDNSGFYQIKVSTTDNKVGD